MDRENEMLANKFLASRSWEERRNILISVGKKYGKGGRKSFSSYVGRSQEDLEKFYELNPGFKSRKTKRFGSPSKRLDRNDVNAAFREESHKDIFHRPHRRKKANELKPHIKDFE
jgi:hypothetical protein